MFSSESFLQAYKRIQYMKQFAQYRKKQGVEVMAQTKTLQNLNSTLFEQRRDQEKILAENRQTKSRLVSDKNTQEQLLTSINKQKKKYAQAQIYGNIYSFDKCKFHRLAGRS